MKVNKFLMLGIAGLAFAACSNEEVEISTNPTLGGNGVVSVKIATPSMTRSAGAATPGTDGDEVEITGELKVTLTYEDADGVQQTQTISVDADNITRATEFKFWNVKTPQKLEASINGGVADYSKASDATVLKQLQVAAVNIPAYGATDQFTPIAGTGDTPNLDNDNDTNSDGTEQGANTGDESKVYQMYEATVNMAIPVARLEVSNISHESHGEEDACLYTQLVANGAYMDTYTYVGGTLAVNATAYTAGGGTGNYSYDGVHWGAKSDLLDEIGVDGAGQSFMSGETLAGPFTYNFYANGTNPIFKIYFGTAKGEGIIEPRYAMITKYKKWNDVESKFEDVTFENGKIYRIVDAELTDENIIGDEDGNTLSGVEATVIEATWTIVDIEADWAE